MKPCAVPGCPELVEGGRCHTHTLGLERTDAWGRGSASDRGYDWRWTKLRNRYIHRHPVCAACEANGITRAGMVVDHVTPIARGGARLSEENLQTLCLECHARKTRAENKG